MFKPNEQLKQDADFDYAIHLRYPIKVYQDSELIDTGIIYSHTKISVYIKDGFYLKKWCQFYT